MLINKIPDDIANNRFISGVIDQEMIFAGIKKAIMNIAGMIQLLRERVFLYQVEKEILIIGVVLNHRFKQVKRIVANPPIFTHRA